MSVLNELWIAILILAFIGCVYIALVLIVDLVENEIRYQLGRRQFRRECERRKVK